VLKMFSVFDLKAGAYMQPFFAPTRGVAVRSFSDAVLSESHEFAKHAEDYALFEVGEFDQVEGVVKATTPPMILMQAHVLLGRAQAAAVPLREVK